MGTIGAGILAVMPLRVISDLHGEEGLRRRLTVEQAKLSGPERVDAAFELAAQLHRDDRYGREPYLNHLLRVAIRIISHYEVRDTEVAVAALLHDAVEDHAAELAGGRSGPGATAALAEVAHRFGDRVAALVAAVTTPAREPAVDRHRQYREFLAASLAREPWARVIKVSDFTDNGVGILYATESAMHRLAVKYRPMTAIYRDLVRRADTPLADHVKRHILDQLDRADQRFDAILADA